MPALPARRPAVVGRRLSEVLCEAHKGGTAHEVRGAAQGASLHEHPDGGGRTWSAAQCLANQSVARALSLAHSERWNLPGQPDRGIGAAGEDREAVEEGKRLRQATELTLKTTGAHKEGRRITFELTRWPRQGALPVQPKITWRLRGQSGLPWTVGGVERGVRPR